MVTLSMQQHALTLSEGAQIDPWHAITCWKLPGININQGAGHSEHREIARRGKRYTSPQHYLAVAVRRKTLNPREATALGNTRPSPMSKTPERSEISQEVGGGKLPTAGYAEKGHWGGEVEGRRRREWYENGQNKKQTEMDSRRKCSAEKRTESRDEIEPGK